MKKFLLIIASIISAVGLNAQSLWDKTIIDYDGYSLTFTVTNVEPAECSVVCSTQPTTLTSIVIPATVEMNGVEVSVTSIGAGAFNECSNMTSIEIPATVTGFGNWPFMYCYNLKSIRCLAETPLESYSGDHFGYEHNIKYIQVPEASMESYMATWPWSDYTITKIYPYQYGEKTIVEEYEGYSLGFTANPLYDGAEVRLETAPETPTAITIPATVVINETEFNVVRIAEYAFASYYEYPGTYRDRDCSSLTSIEIPAGVAEIGSYAFDGCSNLKSIRCLAENAPKVGDKRLGEYLGDLWDIIECIQVPEASIESYKATRPWSDYEYRITKISPYHYGETIVEEYEGYSLRFTANPFCDGAEVRLETAPETSTVITIPSTVVINENEIDVVRIPKYAFTNYDDYHGIYEGYSSLTSVEIPNSVKIIERGAFAYSYNLSSVVFEEKSQLTSIGESAFEECSALKSIEIPASVTRIENSAFRCSKLKKIVFEENSQLTSIGQGAFARCTSLTNVKIPSSVTRIEECAFEECSSLPKVVFEENSQLASIGFYAFDGCSSLTSIEIPSSVTIIEFAAFRECSNLKKVGFEENSQLNIIGQEAFYKTNITRIAIPQSVTEIGVSAFWNILSLSEVTFEENSQLKTIGDGAFEYCEGLINIAIPSNVETIGNNVFYNCNLQNLTFEENSKLTTIGGSAFKNCGGLKSFFIPNTVTEIGNFAFQDCGQLETVTFEEGSQLTSINDILFSGCSNLQKIEIPSEVNYVGFESFANCSNLTMIECHAEKVPQTDSDAFNGCPERMRIQVPAESLEAYKAETPWNNYTLVTEIVQHEIATSLNKEYVGYTEGDGTYFNGESVTVKATARENGESWCDENGHWHSYYGNATFAYWSEDGKFVSNEQEYTFVAESDRNLQANFMEDNHWNPDHNISSHNMSVTADLTIEGVSANDINIEIGAFCGDELRGSARIQYYAPVDKFLYPITVNGVNQDKITFKVYDHKLGREMDYMSKDTLVFVEDKTYGDIDNPQTINFISKIKVELTSNIEGAADLYGAGYYVDGTEITITASPKNGFVFKKWTTTDGAYVSNRKEYTFTVTEDVEYVANFEYAHERSLSSGWNWYSTYIGISGTQGLDAVMKGLIGDAESIKSQTEFINFEPSYNSWVGALTEVNTEDMYMIKMASSGELIIQGTPVNPEDYPIAIEKNWNWIGYPVNVDMSIEDALQNITPKHGDFFKSQENFSQYYEGSGWLGALNVLEPGKGYMYQNTSDGEFTLVYPNAADMNGAKTMKVNVTSANNCWVADMTKYANNMSVIAVVENEGQEMGRYEVAAFCNGECRGSARPIYIEALDRYMIFLTVYGEGNETMTLRYYDLNYSEEYSISEVLAFKVNGTTGSVEEPMVMTLGTLGIGENASEDLNVYPNPAPRNTEIKLGANCDRVEVYNNLGVRVAEYENVEAVEGIETSGIYMIKVIDEGIVKYTKMIVK